MSKLENNNIIFHYLPPAVIEQPSTSLSILQSYLTQEKYSVQTKYWNIILSEELTNNTLSFTEKNRVDTQNTETLLPFILLLNMLFKNSDYLRIKHLLKKCLPEMFVKDYQFYDGYLLKLQQKTANLIKRELNQLPYKDILLHGFSARLDQWVSAIIIAYFIKKNNPEQFIVIGGLDSEEEAVSLMEMVDFFDFAIWGEGEAPLLNLCNGLKAKTEIFNTIPQLIYRKNGNIISSNIKQKDSYLNLDNISPDYADYFTCLERYNLKNINTFIPIENGRGCSWNKCNFCFLNTSYKQRSKSHNRILKEILNYSNQYNLFNFVFTGTDLIGFKNKKFNTFLDKLIQLCENSDFEFTFAAEIIPKNISEEIIKKLSILNFIIQIGYESTSDSLLRKMNKVTRFADLLFFIKNSQKFGLRIKGANILTAIPGETDKDILNSIENLPFLRFFLGEQGFKHSKSVLNIKKGSSFYNDLDKNQIGYWNSNALFDLLPGELLAKLKNKFSIFAFSSSNSVNDHLWKDFDLINDYFEKNKFHYRILYNDNKYIYKEYCSGLLVKSITFDNPLYIDILKISNSKIVSLKSLENILKEKHKDITQKEISVIVEELKNEYLLYYNNNIEESIISIIDF